MANQLVHLLKEWSPQRNEAQWVLGTIYKTSGSCYRKAGAMMLFGGTGQQYGLLSGGCLESDIQRNAKRVMQTNKAITLCYDASDEDDLSFQLGIGCGGTVYILLQPVTAVNNYLGLGQVYDALRERQSGYYYQLIADEKSEVAAHFLIEDNALNSGADDSLASTLVSKQDGIAKNIKNGGNGSNGKKEWLVTKIQPEPHLLVIGGGLDARPVINIAAELGWETSLWDPRPANAQQQYFMAASHILDCESNELTSYAREHRVDAAVLMSHNVKLDAEALNVLQTSSIRYMALLGPSSRRQKVLKAAKLSEADLKIALSGPAGMDIGGELPESIALSIVSECHATLIKKQSMSLSHAA